MNKITFCPHIVMDVPKKCIEDIDDYIISYFINFMSAIDFKKLKVVFSSELLDRFEEYYPWEKIEDDEWSPFVKEWRGLIMSKMSHVDLIDHDEVECNIRHNCVAISTETNDIFNSFLEVIATHSLPNGHNEEAIFSPFKNCNSRSDFINIRDLNDLKLAEYTWYKFYPHNLPCEGEYPFIPPANWRMNKKTKKGITHGYLDVNNCEWKIDDLHKDHWDVQDVRQGRGRYKNVNYDGSIR